MSQLKYEKLTVQHEMPKRKGHRYFMCLCECGKNVVVDRSHLVSGHTKSCGCFRKEKVGNLKRKHGMRATKFYDVWAGMLNRVSNKKAANFKYYGGRGIKVCKEWEVFENFRDDMLASYSEHVEKFGKAELDRINVNGDYCRENCRWVTRAEQMRNQRRNMKLNGEVAVDASSRLGGCESLVKQRVRRGWSITRAFNQAKLTS